MNFQFKLQYPKFCVSNVWSNKCTLKTNDWNESMPHTKPSSFFRWSTSNRSLTEGGPRSIRIAPILTSFLCINKPIAICLNKEYYWQYNRKSCTFIRSIVFMRAHHFQWLVVTNKLFCLQNVHCDLTNYFECGKGSSTENKSRRLLLLLRINETLCRKIENCTFYDR